MYRDLFHNDLFFLCGDFYRSARAPSPGKTAETARDPARDFVSDAWPGLERQVRGWNARASRLTLGPPIG